MSISHEAAPTSREPDMSKPTQNASPPRTGDPITAQASTFAESGSVRDLPELKVDQQEQEPREINRTNRLPMRSGNPNVGGKPDTALSEAPLEKRIRTATAKPNLHGCGSVGCFLIKLTCTRLSIIVEFTISSTTYRFVVRKLIS